MRRLPRPPLSYIATNGPGGTTLTTNERYDMRNLLRLLPAALIGAGLLIAGFAGATSLGWIETLDRALLAPPDDVDPPTPPELGAGSDELGASCHPSAQDRPPIEPTLQPTSGGAWLCSFEITDLDHWRMEDLPDLSSETQLVLLPVPPDFEAWDDYDIEVRQTFRGFEDTYAGENLTGNAFGQLTGQSYTVPWLLLFDPIPWWWEGGTNGTPIFATSFGRGWNLGELGAFDGEFPTPQDPDAEPWTGSSGNITGATNNTNPGLLNLVDNYTTLRWFAGRDVVPVYFSPCMSSTFGTGGNPDWPTGVRCEEDGSPTYKGDRVGPGGGHGGLWPWFHRFTGTRYAFSVKYVPRD